MWGLNCKFQGGVARSLYASQEAVREREILGVGVFCEQPCLYSQHKSVLVGTHVKIFLLH